MAQTTPTAIRDRSVVDLTALKEHLGLEDADTSEDATLQDALDAAKAKADRYCNNPFLNADGSDGDIPKDVEVWVKRKAAQYYDNTTLGVVAESRLGIGSVTRAESLNQVGIARDIEYADLKDLRIEPRGSFGFFI